MVGAFTDGYGLCDWVEFFGRVFFAIDYRSRAMYLELGVNRRTVGRRRLSPLSLSSALYGELLWNTWAARAMQQSEGSANTLQ